MKHLLVPVLALLALSACGKTGPLYLPEKEQTSPEKQDVEQNLPAEKAGDE